MPDPVPSLLPVVAPAPSGTWRSVYWTPINGPILDAAAIVEGTSFQVFGWSRGYVGFAVTPPQQIDETFNTWTDPVAVASYSSDGVHWHWGQTLSLAQSRGGLMTFRSVIEGPSGLLAVGWSGGCASEYVDSLWTSPDGVAWTPVDTAGAFGRDTYVGRISGGPAGFVAVARTGAWTSVDGRTWRGVATNGTPFANAGVGAGTSLSGAFVLAGTTGIGDCGAYTTTGSDLPAPTAAPRTVGAWWSADGSNWTKAVLPGAVARSGGQVAWLAPLGDHAALLVDDAYTDGVPTRFAWGSRDGRTWTTVTVPSDFSEWDVVSAGNRSLLAQTVGDGSTPGPLRLRTIDDKFSLVSIEQHGYVPSLRNVPWGYGRMAVGPTGLVATSYDGTTLWYGQPFA